MEYIVYVKTNENGYITAVNSSEFLTDTTGWTEIDRGRGDRYHHAQGNYFSEPVVTGNGVCSYKLVDGAPERCTEEELAAQKEADGIRKKSVEERLSSLESSVLAMTTLIAGILGQ